jgi:dihydrofolate reductase
MMIAHIVAAAKNNVIGVDNGLPWDIPEDMKWFRDRTKGRALIMGRKTFESVGHPLPNRLNVVVTRQADYKAPEGVVVKPSIEEAIEHCKPIIGNYHNELFIIGGGEIYKQSLPLVDTIYLTRIHHDVEGDATYPEVPQDQFKLVEQIDRTEPVEFSFLTFKRNS